VFITPSQIAMLEAMMAKSGVLESERMGAAFGLLRSRDLLWTPAVNQYMRGERPKLNDLMAWNADGTRMPWRMHSEYLERLYLKNELARGSSPSRASGSICRRCVRPCSWSAPKPTMWLHGARCTRCAI